MEKIYDLWRVMRGTLSMAQVENLNRRLDHWEREWVQERRAIHGQGENLADKRCIEELTAALRPFAKIAEKLHPFRKDNSKNCMHRLVPRSGELRNARATLARWGLEK